MSLRHLVAFQYNPVATEDEKRLFEEALKALPAELPEILEYKLWRNRDSACSVAEHTPNSGHFDILVEATFKDQEAYLRYRDSKAHKGVCPRFRNILSGRAALQCLTTDLLSIDHAREEGAVVSAIIFLKLRHGVSDEDLAVAVDQLRALGLTAVPEARAVGVGVDVGVPTPEGQSQNHSLCILAQLHMDDSDCIDQTGLIKMPDLARWSAAETLEPLLQTTFASQANIAFVSDSASRETFFEAFCPLL